MTTLWSQGRPIAKHVMKLLEDIVLTIYLKIYVHGIARESCVVSIVN